MENMENDQQSTQNKSKKKLILLVLVFVAILFAMVGVGLKWRSQINEYKLSANMKDKQISELQNKLSVKDSLPAGSDKTSVINGENIKIIFQHSSDWNSKLTAIQLGLSKEDTKSYSLAISNPKSIVSVLADTNIDGIGGGCIVAESPAISYLKSIKLPNSPGYSFVTYYAPGGIYEAAVMKDSSIKDVKLGSSVCDLRFASYMSIDTNGSVFKISLDSAKYTLSSTVQNKVSQDVIVQYFDSLNFKDAQKILLTAKISK